MKTLKWENIDKVLNVLFSFGAAVVIFGAMCKILHWKGADIAITVGLLSEVGIFLIMGVVEMLKPKQVKEVTPQFNDAPINSSYSLPNVDLTDDVFALKVNLTLLNKKIEDILKS